LLGRPRLSNETKLALAGSSYGVWEFILLVEYYADVLAFGVTEGIAVVLDVAGDGGMDCVVS